MYVCLSARRNPVTVHGLGPLTTTVRGNIPGFAAQKLPLTPESCSYGTRSQRAFLSHEQ